MTEVERLKTKCNQYAKRLVLLGETDVALEVTKFNIFGSSDYTKCPMQGGICTEREIIIAKCNNPDLDCPERW